MKKNILTIIIMAMSLINIILSAVIVFVIVPTSNKTNQLVSKVASIIDLELESPENRDVAIAVSDIVVHELDDKLTINLKSDDGESHFALVTVSLSINSKHKDTEALQPKIQENENEIKEIVTEEFSKYTVTEVSEKKDEIKQQVLTRIQEYFQSDFIVNVSFGNFLLQ
ncbi:flagellar basal body-associated FliL family protein [Lachnospiraceae bacterium MD1]|uniref:Flagellar protein FliL n=1 Tax=Variimorphobacter saccharofermentans TaxID=2755051 RepID=A0A839JZY3_9FIRM|nr:flagellar basal body-associated FliL family protein [Variimorphobacter saccharofermentans]MBB2182748.1 flagellar basal body-associated FliL family protein [Variimorphobacter saccharofermentans]